MRISDWSSDVCSSDLNGDDTTQVFRIMKALNAGNSERNFARLLATEEGGRTAYERVELAQRFTDKAWIAQFAPGTVGAAYREFLETTGYSADRKSTRLNSSH